MRAGAAAALALGVGGAPLAAGGPVCGAGEDFNAASEEHRELCTRWYQQAALLPLMWVAAPPPARDPVELPRAVRASEAVRLRYDLLPYLRALVRQALREGVPAARYMALEYPRDREARGVAHAQWMLGPALLVAPATVRGESHVKVYLPDEEGGVWRFLYGGEQAAPKDIEDDEESEEDDPKDDEEEEEEKMGRWVEIRLDASSPILLLRPGYIIPRAADVSEATSAEEAVAGGVRLTASLRCPVNELDDEVKGRQEPALSCSAEGELLLPGRTQPLHLSLQADDKGVKVNWICTTAVAFKRAAGERRAVENTLRTANSLVQLDMFALPTNRSYEDDVPLEWVSGSNAAEAVTGRMWLGNGRLTLIMPGHVVCGGVEGTESLSLSWDAVVNK